MRQRTKSFVGEIDYCLFDVKPLSEPKWIIFNWTLRHKFHWGFFLSKYRDSLWLKFGLNVLTHCCLVIPLCVVNLTIIWSIRIAGITDISGGKIRHLGFASWRRHIQLIINTISEKMTSELDSRLNNKNLWHVDIIWWLIVVPGTSFHTCF